MEKEAFYKQSTLPHLTGEDANAIPMPKKIGPYKIEALLSKGGMSYLYLARHPEKPLSIVVKVLSPRYMTHPEMVDQFVKEAKIIGMTDHPNIVKLYGQGEWASGLYIAMEFVRGISLKQFIIQQNLSLKSALEIILQVSYALLHLHTHGVIHRDLKPENILITESGQIKVIDFGIAQLHAEEEQEFLTKKGQFLGTPSYMSPEQRKDPLSVTYASDIYSLGVIAFELIVGKLSFGSIQLALLPAKLQKIVEKALKQNRDKRYQDVVEFITDITQFLRTEIVSRESGSEPGVKEIWEKLELSHQSLLPPSIPKWNSFDIGFAHLNKPLALNTFYEFLRFADQSYLTLFGEYQAEGMEPLAYVGMLKGIVQTLTYEHLRTTDKKFHPNQFMTSLNEALKSHPKKPKFTFCLLYLNPVSNQFSYISCGFPPLVHVIGDNQKLRLIANQNPLVGEEGDISYYKTTENWNEGDTLVLHSFVDTTGKVDEKTKEIVPRHLQLSAKSQSQEILSELMDNFPNSHLTSLVLCLERIV